MRILLAGDTHLPPGDAQATEAAATRLCAIARRQRADAVALAGDLVEGWAGDPRKPPVEQEVVDRTVDDLVAEVDDRQGLHGFDVAVVAGNHDNPPAGGIRLHRPDRLVLLDGGRVLLTHGHHWGCYSTPGPAGLMLGALPGWWVARLHFAAGGRVRAPAAIGALLRGERGLLPNVIEALAAQAGLSTSERLHPPPGETRWPDVGEVIAAAVAWQCLADVSASRVRADEVDCAPFAREAAKADPRVRFVLAGHTHRPLTRGLHPVWPRWMRDQPVLVNAGAWPDVALVDTATGSVWRGVA